MDLLSDVLKVVRLDSAIYFNAEFSEPWCLHTPDSRQVAPILAPGSEHVIIYHLLCDGQAYVQYGQPPARYRKASRTVRGAEAPA